LLSSEEILIVAIRSGENFSAKHFSVIAFLKKLVTLGRMSALRHPQVRHYGGTSHLLAFASGVLYIAV
jgi:hypothetical protein